MVANLQMPSPLHRLTHTHIYIYNICIYSTHIYIRRPRPSPRQGRRLGPPQVWNLLSCSPLLVCQSWQRLTSQLLFQTDFKPRQTFLAGLEAVAMQLQQVPDALAVSFYGGSRLPFASLENSPNLSLQLPGATPAAADLSCSSNKALRPWQCPFMEVQGCRWPGLETSQTLPSARRRHSGRGRPFLQPEQGPEAVASLQLPGATQAAADFPAAPTSP